jgi:RHS repeat-associated protein
LGSASLELDETGDIISYEEYHPFGTTSYRSGRDVTEVSLKRYKYVGKERDNETGLYYYGARYYADWIARFVSVDPLQHKYPHYTPYQYAGNKPVTFIDLDGMEEAKPYEENSNILIYGSNTSYKRIKKALDILKIIKPKDFDLIEKSKIPIKISFEKLNNDVTYEQLNNDPNITKFSSTPKTSVIKGVTNTTFSVKDITDIKIYKDDYGNPEGGSFLRLPNLEEQETARDSLFQTNSQEVYSPSNDLKLLNVEEAINKIEVKEIEIKIDTILNNKDKDLTIVLGHEFFGHTEFNILNKVVGYLWQMIEEKIKPEHPGHSLNNPSGIQAEKIENEIKEKYREANKEYKRNEKEK